MAAPDRRSARGPQNRHATRRMRAATTRRFLQARRAEQNQKLILLTVAGILGGLLVLAGAWFMNSATEPVEAEPEIAAAPPKQEPTPEKPKPVEAPKPTPKPVKIVDSVEPEVVELEPEPEPEPEPERPLDPLLAALLERVPGADPNEWRDPSAREVYERCSSQPVDRLDLARYCLENSMKAEAERLLHDHWKQGGAAAREVDELLADSRGEEVPEGGYLWDNERGFEHPDSRDARKAVDRAQALCTSASGIAKHTDAKRLRKQVEAIEALLETDGLDEAAQASIRAAALDALRQHRARRMEKLKKSAAKAKVADLGGIKKSLDAARRDALRVIFDLSVYPDEDHGRVGQPRVDEAVGRVREIWDAENYLALLPEAVREEIEELRRIDDEVIPAFGGGVDAADLDSLCATIHGAVLGMVREIGGKNLKNAVEEASRYHRETFQLPASAGPEIIEQVEILNAYRLMLGVAPLKLDARLVRAAQFHSGNMERKGTIWHDGDDGTPSSRASKEGFGSGVGENCASGCPTAQAAHDGWYHSSGHHRNMLGSGYTVIGVGAVDGYWTQMFGGGSAVPK